MGIMIYNVKGQLVKVLVNGSVSPGIHEITWDGRNQKGMGVSSGIYFVRMVAKNYHATQKIVLLK